LVKRLAAVLILLAAPVPAFAQIHSAANSAEMRKLDFLLGAWEGEGWMDFGPGRRHATKVKESAQGKAEGSVLTFEGMGKARAPGKDEELVVHSAFGIVWYDGEAKRFRMMAWREGRSVDADITVGEKSLVWASEISASDKFASRSNWTRPDGGSRSAKFRATGRAGTSFSR
jgi:hypothetical protein